MIEQPSSCSPSAMSHAAHHGGCQPVYMVVCALACALDGVKRGDEIPYATRKLQVCRAAGASVQRSGWRCWYENVLAASLSEAPSLLERFRTACYRCLA